MKKLRITLAALALVLSSTLFAQYNASAGKNRIATEEKVIERPAVDASGQAMKDDHGNYVMEKVTMEVAVTADKYGNADGNQYDLATDGAFEGNTIAVLHLYTGEGFDFSLPKAALEEKGFSVFRWIDNPPSPEELRTQLKKASQLWVISSNLRKLTDEHAEVIKEFFESGKGLYIWGDNEPYYADANFLCQKIFGTTMTGNLEGGQTVGISGEASNRAGIVDGHLIATGVANMYEGITIATVAPTQDLSVLVYGSADLFYSWDTAGTGRYVKNAAAWMVNYERFGELVYNK